jgi:FlaA1/EpsC-like NDP-sugar epimerase
MSKGLLRISQVVIDLLALSAAFAVAFVIRFDGDPPAPMLMRMVLTGPYAVLIEYAVLFGLGVHRLSWRYIGLPDTRRIFLACLSGSSILVGMRFGIGFLNGPAQVRYGVIPYGVLGVNLALSFLAVTGVRFARRTLGEGLESKRRRPAAPATRTLLVGAGEAGVLVARELTSRPDLALRAVGFVDDDPRKAGTVIHGLPVLGTTSELPSLCARLRVKQALITMPNVSGGVVRRIRQLCDEARVPAKIIPGVYEIVGGQVNLSRMRDVAIEDLLKRDAVTLDRDELSAFVHGKIVLATGAGGSIGSELCRQLCAFSPRRLLLVERSENALFNIHRELTQQYPELDIVPCIADITDQPRMSQLFSVQKPNLVLHAAAHKHVPMLEWNPGEAVKNNVFGSKAVADLAVEHGAEAFVMISTDKAVNPSSVMGATKRAAEVYVQSLSERCATRVVTVRFGNVLGSAGSVVPIFSEQIQRGGPVTVTHPDMRRYFMTIPEACQLVLQAGAMGRGGEIFVLDMGEPVKIVDLARDLIALSGLREKDDIDIVFTGVRPGEKLFEELATQGEGVDKTRHPKIFVGKLQRVPRAEVERHLAELRSCLTAERSSSLIPTLRLLVPEYEVHSPAPLVAEAKHAEALTSAPDVEPPLMAATARQ